MIGTNWPFNDEPWAEDALCTETDPELFFPEKGSTPHRAKKICLGCAVRIECRDYALRNREPFGVWGGTTERERRRILKTQEHPAVTLDAEPDHNAA